MTLYGSRMLLQDIRFFYGWLSNRNSQLKIDFIGFVYIVLIDAHSVSATMKITTTCSLSAPILKRSGGMFVTDAKGWDEWIRWATVTWHGKSFINFSRKLSFAATVYHVWQEWNARMFCWNV
jgi:hypothetical protein